MAKTSADWMQDWLDNHPGTVLYIAIMVTASVILQLVQVLSQ